MSRLLDACGVPERYAEADLLAGPPPALADGHLEAWDRLRGLLLRLARGDATGVIVLAGPRGGGKTHLACAAVLAACRAGLSAEYRSLPAVLLEIKATFGQPAARPGDSEAGILKALARPELLVLDEAHERAGGEWDGRLVRQLVDARYAAMRSTLLLTNQEPEVFFNGVGDSVRDRCHDDQGGVVVAGWPSLRGASAQRNAPLTTHRCDLQSGHA